MVIVALAVALAAEPCLSTTPPDTTFAAPAPEALDDVRLVVEIWVDGAPSAWVAALSTALSARDAVGVFVIRPARATELAPALGGHAVGLDLRAGVPDQGDPYSEAAAIRSKARLIRGATHKTPKAVLAPMPRRANEATLGLAGFSLLLDYGAASGTGPRLAARYAGTRGGAVVLPSAPGAGACAPTGWAPFRPDVADRATRALRAAAGGGLAVVRVVVDGRAAAPEDAAVLGRWLDTLPVSTADLRALPAEIRHTPVRDRAPAVGRLVPVADLRLAAAALVAARGTLPRELPGGLSLSEAWLGLVMVLAERTDGEMVRLGAIHGPGNDARSVLAGETGVARSDVLAMATALTRALPAEIPAALTLGSQPMTAAESLIALASAALGDDPVLTRALAVPEPNQRGLGWGDATVP